MVPGGKCRSDALDVVGCFPKNFDITEDCILNQFAIQESVDIQVFCITANTLNGLQDVFKIAGDTQ